MQGYIYLFISLFIAY